MKTKLLLAFIAISSVASATAFNVNSGVLANTPDVAFRGGASMVRLDGGELFKMQARRDRVGFSSVANDNWSFDQPVVVPSDLSLADIHNITESDIMTIVATALHNSSKQYHIGLIKYISEGRMRIRVVSAYVIPEPETFALIAGFLALGFVMIKRRRA